jgi:uncharacterized membrane protein YjgN (DUF898 family)
MKDTAILICFGGAAALLVVYAWLLRKERRHQALLDRVRGWN